MELQAAIRCSTALNIYALEGETPANYISGGTPDISSLAEFAWYDWVYFITPGKMINTTLGRYVGPSFDIGEEMCTKILSSSGHIFHRTSVFPVSPEELRTDLFKTKALEFTNTLAENVANRDPEADDGFADEGNQED